MRCSWMAAILAVVGCWTAPDPISGTTTSDAGMGGGTGGAATSTGTGTSTDTRADVCKKTYTPPHLSCKSPCLAMIEEGHAPLVLYEYANPASYAIHAVLAVTDDFVVATATSATSGSDAYAWTVIEIPRAGGDPPAVVDAIGAYDISTNAIDGGDGYLYYGAGPAAASDPSLPVSIILSRLSLTTRG